MDRRTVKNLSSHRWILASTTNGATDSWLRIGAGVRIAVGVGRSCQYAATCATSGHCGRWLLDSLGGQAVNNKTSGMPP